jgi:hypothetical protein
VYITPQFVQEFLELFDSEESFERDYLKNILHKLYAKVSFYQPLFATPSIKTAKISNQFLLVSPQEENDQKGHK